MGILLDTYSLQSLNISDNKLGRASGPEIGEVVASLRKLTWLSVASNDLTDCDIFPILEHIIIYKEIDPQSSMQVRLHQCTYAPVVHVVTILFFIIALLGNVPRNHVVYICTCGEAWAHCRRPLKKSSGAQYSAVVLAWKLAVQLTCAMSCHGAPQCRFVCISLRMHLSFRWQ